MTYQDRENSPHGGAPVELYKFEGTYENYYYTTSARKITFGFDDNDNPITYIPIPLERTEIVAGTQDDDGLDITMTLPASSQLVLVYGFEAAPPDLYLTIYRYHDQANVVAYWVGPVSQITTNDGISTVQSVSELGQALAQDFPDVYYQGPCNNNLFDERCKVIEANFSGTANVVTVNKTLIAVDAIPSGAAGRSLDGILVGGEFVLPSGERRMIVSQVGVVIQVNFPFSIDIAVDEVVSMTAGCDHGYMSDCKLTFNNQRNFGGFPFISENNPFTDTIADGQVLPDHTCLPEPFSGVFYTIAKYGVEPCNPAWTGNQTISRDVPLQPNGPGGKQVTGWSYNNSGPDVQENYEFVVEGNPKLQGQLLTRFTITNFNVWKLEFFFEVPNDGWIVTVFPESRYCGSVGKDSGTVGVNSTLYCTEPVDHGVQLSSGLATTLWTW